MSYITIQDIRDQGLLEADYSDDEVTAAIAMWQAFIDRACRQWFEPKAMTLSVDGNNSDALHFGVPIISIEYIKLNNDQAALDTSYYKIYNRRDDLSDRQNPRIKLVNSSDYSDIYTVPSASRRMIFRKGRQNQEIKGVFGYTEDDGSVPLLIQRALTKLVVEKLTQPLYSAPGTLPGGSTPAILGNLLEEWTDGHKIKYSQQGGESKPVAAGLRGITNDQEILDIIKLYKAPLGVATPANPSYR